MTPSGIEPATCQFVAQCLNQYATMLPLYWQWCIKSRDKRIFVHMQNLLPINTTGMELTVPQLAKKLSPKVYYNVHNSLTVIYVLSQTKSINNVTFFKIQFNVFVLSTPRVSFLQNSTPKLCRHSCFFPHMPHAPPISSSLIYSKAKSWRFSSQTFFPPSRYFFLCRPNAFELV